MNVGIMQGRLMPEDPHVYQRFPLKSWREELRCIRESGFDAVEWLFDRPENNPLLELGGEKIAAEVSVSRLLMDSLCLHYTAANDVLRKDSPAYSVFPSILRAVLLQGDRAGIRRYVFPVMEASAMRSDEDKETLKGMISEVAPALKKNSSVICLETDKSAGESRALLQFLDSSSVMLHYDIGNAAACGFNVSEELRELEGLLGGVHIKDKNSGGKNVRLGSGLVPWKDVFRVLNSSASLQSLILETTMGDDPVSSAAQQLQYVRGFIG